MFEEDIRSARIIAVTECVCRKEASLTGHQCKHPMENCLSFGVAAEFYIETPFQYLQLLPLRLCFHERHHHKRSKPAMTESKGECARLT